MSGILQMVATSGPIGKGASALPLVLLVFWMSLVIDLLAELVPCREADVAATCDIDGGKIERLSKQTLLERRGHELIDLVAERSGQPVR